MTRETLELVKKALNENSIYALFSEKIGIPEEVENEDSTNYALMFNFEKEELFFLDYATSENNWAQIAEQQNPWIKLAYVSATDILMGDPAGEIEEKMLFEVEEYEQMERERNEYEG